MSAKATRPVWEKLLIVAYGLSEGEDRPLTGEDLVVAAWRRYPRAFGLRGHDDDRGLPRYPDSNRVYAELMGSKPIRKRGFLKKVGTKLYKLTPSGQTLGRQLNEEEPGQPSSSGFSGGKATMSREIRGKLERLLRSRAVLREQSGEIDRATFHDACVFWGITAHSKRIELEGALAEVENAIMAAEESVKSGASELRTGAGNLSLSTADLLRKVHEHLKERFSTELATIRGRV